MNVHVGSHRGAAPTPAWRGFAEGARRRWRCATTWAGRRRRTSSLVLENGSGGGSRARDDDRGARRDRRAASPRGAWTARGSAFCLDAAHLWGAGYPVDTAAGVDAAIDGFDAAVGLDRLRLVHLNDSRSELGSRATATSTSGRGGSAPRGSAGSLTHPRLDARHLPPRDPGHGRGLGRGQPRPRPRPGRRPAARRAAARRRSRPAARKGRSAPADGRRRRWRARDEPPPTTRRGTDADRGPAPRRLELAVLVAILVLAALTRLPGLDARGQWDADQGTDMLVLRALVEDGEVPLLGPKTSIGSSTTAPSTTGCSPRRRSSPTRTPSPSRSSSRCSGSGPWRRSGGSARLVGGPLAAAAAGLLRGGLPRRHRRVHLHLEPEPDPAVRRARVRGRDPGSAVGTRPLVAPRRRRRDGHDAAPHPGRGDPACRSPGPGRPTSSRAGAPVTEPDGGRRSAAGSAPSRSSRRATCRSSPTSSATASRRRARSSAYLAGGGAEAAGGALGRHRHGRPSVDHVAVRRRDHGPPDRVAGGRPDRHRPARDRGAPAARGRARGRRGPRRDPLAPGRARGVRRRPRPVRPEPRDGDRRACPTTTTTTSWTRSCSRWRASGSRASPRRWLNGRRDRGPGRSRGALGRGPRRDRGHGLAAPGLGDGGWPARRPGRGTVLLTVGDRADDPRRDPAVQERRTRCASRSSAGATPSATASSTRAPADRRHRVRPAVRGGRRRALRRPGGGRAGSPTTPGLPPVALRGPVRGGLPARALGLRRDGSGDRALNANAGPCRPAFAVPETRTQEGDPGQCPEKLCQGRPGGPGGGRPPVAARRSGEAGGCSVAPSVLRAAFAMPEGRA